MPTDLTPKPALGKAPVSIPVPKPGQGFNPVSSAQSPGINPRGTAGA